MQTQSIGGKKSYFATFINDYSRVSWIYYVQHKSEFHGIFDNFKAYVNNQFGKEIKVFRSDRGGEYKSTDFIQKLTALGIIHQTTIAHTPQQNGLAEQMNRTIGGSAKSMLHAAGLSFGFWVEAVSTANYTRNRCPSRVIGWISPLEKLTGKAPEISHLRVFGCKAFVRIPDKQRKKLEKESSVLTFVGYEANSKGYRFWDSSSRSFKASRDAIFDETVFPSRPTPHIIHSVPTLPPKLGTNTGDISVDG